MAKENRSTKASFSEVKKKQAEKVAKILAPSQKEAAEKFKALQKLLADMKSGHAERIKGAKAEFEKMKKEATEKVKALAPKKKTGK